MELILCRESLLLLYCKLKIKKLLNMDLMTFEEYQDIYGSVDELDLPINAKEYIDGILYVYPELIP